MKITVYTTHYNKLELLLLQHQYMTKWCKEDINYVVINNGIDESTKTLISTVCQNLGIQEILITKNDKIDMTAMNHKTALQFCYSNYIASDNSDIRIVMDCDIVPFQAFSFVEMLGAADMAGVKMTMSNVPYIASFITMFSKNVDLTNIDVGSNIEFDSGMFTMDLVRRYTTKWLDHTAPIRSEEASYIFGNIEYDPNFGIQFITPNLLHYYRGTGWDNTEPTFYKRKSGFIKRLIQNPSSFHLKLDDRVCYDSAHMDQWINKENYRVYNELSNISNELK